MTKITLKSKLLAGSVLGLGALAFTAFLLPSASAAQTSISEEQAVSLAMESVSGSLEEVELETSDGKQVWEVEIKGFDGETELEIDAETGEILSSVFEAEDDGEEADDGEDYDDDEDEDENEDDDDEDDDDDDEEDDDDDDEEDDDD